MSIIEHLDKEKYDDLKQWFYNIFYSCETFSKNKDVVLLSKNKIEEIDILDWNEGNVLFEIDWKHKTLVCDFPKIWSYLETNFDDKIENITLLISSFLKNTKYEDLYPYGSHVFLILNN